MNILEKLFTQKDMDDSYLLGKKSQNSDDKITQEVNKYTLERKIRDRSIIEDLVSQSNRILVSISSHKIPFDIFPDTLNIEESRITIITRKFLFSEVHSVDIKDISNVFINMMPFYGQLDIVSKTFEDNEIWVNALRKQDAIYARRIIEGLRVFVNKNLNTSSFSREELLAKLEELSTTQTVT